MVLIDKTINNICFKTITVLLITLCWTYCPWVGIQKWWSAICSF